MSTDKREIYGTEQAGGAREEAAALSPWARYWARQSRGPQDSHLVSFGERVTYTFAVGNEVASIHYDHGRNKLFYKGHRINQDNMERWMLELMKHFKVVLAKSEYSDRFLEGFTALLDKMQGSPTKKP